MEECLADNNRVFDVGKEPNLPRHPKCRCFLVPILDEKKVSSSEKDDIVKENNDKKEFEKYKEILGEDAPKSLKEFQ